MGLATPPSKKKKSHATETETTSTSQQLHGREDSSSVGPMTRAGVSLGEASSSTSLPVTKAKKSVGVVLLRPYGPPRVYRLDDDDTPIPVIITFIVTFWDSCCDMMMPIHCVSLQFVSLLDFLDSDSYPTCL